MAKVFPLGYQLTDADLMFAYMENGVGKLVDSVEVKIYKLTGGVKLEMRLSEYQIRTDGLKYWFDSRISYALSEGEYEIAWIFTVDAVTRVAVDEFTVVKDLGY